MALCQRDALKRLFSMRFCETKPRPTWQIFGKNSDLHKNYEIVLASCREAGGDPQIAERAFGWSNSRRKRSIVVKVMVVQSSGVVGGILAKIGITENWKKSRSIGRGMEQRVLSARVACQACARRGPAPRVLSRGHLVDGLPRATTTYESAFWWVD